MDLERELHNLAQRVAALEARAFDPSTAAQPLPNQTPPAPPGAPTFLPPLGVDGVSQPPPPPPPGMVPNQPPPAGVVTQVPPPPIGSAPIEPRPPVTFEGGIESLLRWAGVALVTLAGIFLVSTAISRGWIGPELQLFGAALGGAGLLASAFRFRESRRPWALALGCGGSVVLTTCALATHFWLDLAGPGIAIVLAALATMISLALAVETRLEGIALVGALTGMLATLDTLNEFGDGAILAWVTFFILGASALGLMKQWAGLRLITAWLGALVLVLYAVTEGAEGALQAVGFIGAGVIGATLWAGPIAVQQLSGTQGSSDQASGTPGSGTPGSGWWGTFDWTPVDYRLVAFVPAWVAAVVGGLLPLDDNYQYGIVALVTAVGFLGLAEATFGRVERIMSLSTFFGAFSLAAIGFVLWLDGPALMVALAGQAATSYFLSRKLDDGLLRIGSYVVGLIASALAVFEMLRAFDDEGYANAGVVLATLILVVAWIAAAFVLHQRADTEELAFEPAFVGAWAGSMLWLAAAFIGFSQGQMLISAAWALMACAGLVVGLTRRIDVVKNTALGTLAITLTKLVTIDLAEVDVFWRVGLFFVVGMGLIVLGLKIPSLMGKAPGEATTAPADESVSTF